MAALRSRAVELVGEAFSGGAEDPTALQLQADELYGMEEALAARVTAAFRAQRWQELSLDCAKAAIRRASLLADAASIMDRYAKDARVRHRRLEVRFDGESGFDAASGSEAGVTRGFYADVAEALVSCEHVSGVQSVPTCKSIMDLDGPEMTHKVEAEGDFAVHGAKLPLWIPDMDSSCTVIIPTPRASRRSTIGLFPRPLSRQDPSMDAVKAQFRLIGRMFAAAMREGFMFPLPLSCSFLKLVQSLSDSPPVATSSSCDVQDKSDSVIDDDSSMGENSPPRVSMASNFSNPQNQTGAQPHHGVLTSADLPRPGFLGGEIYAVETFVCSALDAIEAECGDKDEIERRMQDLASDRTFAPKALGKPYECSFEEYFQDKTFVDPLDPSQGEHAHPLCASGHMRSVNIHNVREWVVLARDFILQDGVMEQALSFMEGINDFFSARYLCLFTPRELQRDICGCGDNVGSWNEGEIRRLFKLDGKTETEPLVASGEIVGEAGAGLSRRFSASSPTIGFLIDTLKKSSTRQRRQFLSFVTSVPIATPGKIEVVPIVSPSGEFLPVGDNCLPRANTCARKLFLPKFNNLESFSSVFWSVLREESRFKGFYEWRGN
uniref:HECT domain-containing protein n=1 Tax=Cyclophora tenuis TaxID=216820 RepID=A0A7S1D0B9_CYCTE|mmetsp:Transcript_17161/g.29121  ORF Transcript_17161/g.29121 Transcript_17161/m.29121 type:complete len:608 (+) Transcript_17161:46-1869(+)